MKSKTYKYLYFFYYINNLDVIFFVDKGFCLCYNVFNKMRYDRIKIISSLYKNR